MNGKEPRALISSETPRLLKPSAVETYVREVTGCTDRAALEQWQLFKLREMLRYAKKRSRFYTEHLKDADPEKIRSFEDLRKIPFTSAEDLRALPQDWLCLPASGVQRIVTLKTSGTERNPKRIFFSAEELQDTVNFFAEGMTELSGPGDKVMILFPCSQPDSVGDLLAKAVEQRGIPAVREGVPRDFKETARRIREEGCTVLAGIPTHILAVTEALALSEAGTIHSVLLSADTTPAPLLGRIEGLLGCETFPHYGMTELGYGVAVECGAHSGCHLKECDFLVELIDPETGLPQSEGKPGEFVFTTLRRKAMPFIRYRTGDMGYLFSGVCECGSMVKRILPWGGRRNGKSIAAGPRRLTQWELDEILFSVPGLIDYEIREDAGSPELTVYGVEMPDAERVREVLAEPGKLGGTAAGALKIQVKVKEGFTGGGMQKRNVAGIKEIP